MARPKGALGKNKAFLLNRLQSMYGKDFDPVMKMAEQAAFAGMKKKSSQFARRSLVGSNMTIIK